MPGGVASSAALQPGHNSCLWPQQQLSRSPSRAHTRTAAAAAASSHDPLAPRTHSCSCSRTAAVAAAASSCDAHPLSSVVALDVEFSHFSVSVSTQAAGSGPAQQQQWQQVSAPAWVALVDHECLPLLNTRIQPQVPRGARWFGGVHPADTASAPALPAVLEQLQQHLAGKTLLGHGLAKDLAALGLRHPLDQRLDTMSHPAFCNKAGSALSLKQLAAHHLGMAIQEGAHDPQEDAAAVMQLYTQVVFPSTYEGQVAAATAQLLVSIQQRQQQQQLLDDYAG